MNKKKLREIIGKNIRDQRIARSISIDELSEMLSLTSGFIGLIERGQRGATNLSLYKLSEIFDVTIDSFFYPESAGGLQFSEEFDDTAKVRRKKVASLISNLSADELEFIIQVVKSLRKMTCPAERQEDEDETEV